MERLEQFLAQGQLQKQGLLSLLSACLVESYGVLSDGSVVPPRGSIVLTALVLVPIAHARLEASLLFSTCKILQGNARRKGTLHVYRMF